MIENLEIEVFRNIKGYEGLYQVSNKGRVFSLKSRKFLSPFITYNGYQKINLYNGNKKIKKEYIHRIVALVFIPNPEQKSQINHINEIKTDNSVKNLEWMTAKENVNYGNRNKKASKSKNKPILQYTIEGKFITEYSSLNEVMSLFNKGVGDCLRGRNKTSGGFVWKYKERNVEVRECL